MIQRLEKHKTAEESSKGTQDRGNGNKIEVWCNKRATSAKICSGVYSNRLILRGGSATHIHVRGNNKASSSTPQCPHSPSRGSGPQSTLGVQWCGGIMMAVLCSGGGAAAAVAVVAAVVVDSGWSW